MVLPVEKIGWHEASGWFVDLEQIWDGQLILMTRRVGLVSLSRRFDVTWFLGAIHKYRRQLAEVVVASFFLQIFALISPLFFHVVIDKVLVHGSLGTLDVLVMGLVTISVFETTLAILRTYVFAHTTNRIDVELGARLFHLMLHVDLLLLVSRKCQVQLGEEPVVTHLLEFIAIVEVGGGVLLTEEQPVGAGVAERASFLQKTAEGCDSGARTDHDHRRVRIARRPEIARWPHIDRDRIAGGAVRKVRRAHPTAWNALEVVAHRRDGQVDFARAFFGA